MPFRRKGNPALKVVYAHLTSLCVNLTRLEEVKTFRLPEELEMRASMVMSDMGKLLKSIDEGWRSFPKDVLDSLEMVRAYAYISTREGVGFIEENSDRILRAVRWCISDLERHVARA